MKKAHVDKSELEQRLEAEAAAEAAADAAKGKEKASAENAGEAVSGPEAPAVDVEALQKERDAMADQLLRMRAEFDNYRKRIARDSERNRQMAAEALMRDILPVVDHLELAMRHKDDHPGALAEGVAMVLRQFHEVLGKHGLEPIAAQGEPFDPVVHEAVMQRESEEVPAESVVEEFQKGYRLGQTVLRPAKVVVSAGPRNGASGVESEEPGMPGDEAAPEA